VHESSNSYMKCKDSIVREYMGHSDSERGGKKATTLHIVSHSNNLPELGTKEIIKKQRNDSSEQKSL